MPAQISGWSFGPEFQPDFPAGIPGQNFARMGPADFVNTSLPGGSFFNVYENVVFMFYTWKPPEIKPLSNLIGFYNEDPSQTSPIGSTSSKIIYFTFVHM